MKRKIKLDNGHDIHVSSEDDGNTVCANIGHGLLSAEFRLQAHDAKAFAQALLDGVQRLHMLRMAHL